MSKKTKNEPIAPDLVLGKAEAFVIKYKYAFIGAILAIIAFAAFSAFVGGSSSSESKSNSQADVDFAKIEQYVNYGDYETALNGNDENMGLIEIVDTYGGTDAANKACLYTGLIYAEKKQYEDAIHYLEQYKGNDNIVAAKAKHTLGNCYSHMGNYEKAIGLTLEAANLAENIAVTPACWRDAAAMYEILDNKTEALKLYNRIKNEYPMSPIASEATVKINAAAK